MDRRLFFGTVVSCFFPIKTGIPVDFCMSTGTQVYNKCIPATTMLNKSEWIKLDEEVIVAARPLLRRMASHGD